MPTHFRRYYQYIEKDTDNVSPIWKVGHIFLFALIVIDAFCIAYTFHDIYDSFNYRCILYSKPYLRIRFLDPQSTVGPRITTTEAMMNLSAIPGHNKTQNMTLGHTQPSSNSTTELQTITTLIGDDEVDIYMGDDFSSTTTTSTEAFTNITGTIPTSTGTNTTSTDTTTTVNGTTPASTNATAMKVQISNNRYYIWIASRKGQVFMDTRRTIFGTRSTCNSVLFFPLMSLVLGSFAMVMVLICGKGGRGYSSDILQRSWSYVYPILIHCIVMIIISTVMVNIVENGMNRFCKYFHKFTQSYRCNLKMNYFTGYRGVGTKDYYQTYKVCLWASYIAILLWAAQALWTIIRIVYVADFSLNIITVSSARRSSLIFGKDPVHAALMDSFKGMSKISHVEDHEYDTDNDIAEESEELHLRRKARIRQGKKKVAFDDEPSASELSDNDEDKARKARGQSVSRYKKVDKAFSKSHANIKKVKFAEDSDNEDKDDDDTTEV